MSASLDVQFWRGDLTWRVAGWSGGSWKDHVHGSITVEELSVVSDRLQAEGVLGSWQVAMIGRAIAKALREQLQQRGDTARADAAALALRKLGVTAMASDAYVVLPLADAEALAAKLAR